MDPLSAWEWALTQGNPRVRDWPLMNPYHCLALILAYLAAIYTLVRIMKKQKEPMKLKWVATVHNIHLTLLSLYMCIECIRQAVTNNYSLWGNGVDDSPKGYGMARILWIFYVSKVVEFGDTIIMALKKNFHQITFLHVYHHVDFRDLVGYRLFRPRW